jgi:NAD(P)-dependent dehydrogenase (short-subunit alcohol dehydrogenase family)
MVAAGGGRVVNLSSGSATGPGHVASAYNVSKTALARITGSTHLAGAEHGVLAFDLAPGVVRTDMTESMRAHDDRTEWTAPAQVTELLLAVVGGELDAWSGRLIRAGADTPASLRDRARQGLDDAARTVCLAPYGPGDPLA